jgi:hypothetical protein
MRTCIYLLNLFLAVGARLEMLVARIFLERFILFYENNNNR